MILTDILKKSTPKFRIIICFIIFGMTKVFSQTITVEQNLPGETQQEFVERLVTDVLIGSECANITQIRASTGIDFNGPTGGNNPNGIGFFDFGNLTQTCDDISNPFITGVLLTSGDALNVANTSGIQLSEGETNWPGDLELNQVINSALAPGIDPINSINATSIEFQFEASANNFSFRFFMASEEYDQSFECDFSDAFAFILTRPDGTQENLAVIPNTSTPITVTNVHDTICPDTTTPPIGEPFFCEEFNGGQGFFAFNGYTTPFIASANVIPGETYRIKLVVADDGRMTQDTAFDSGVFIQGGSFTGIGSSLPDFTVDTRDPGCGDEAVILDTRITDASATFQWFKEDNANPANPPILIPGATNSVYEVLATGPFGGDGRYIVVVTFGSNNCTSEDDAIVEFVNQPEIANPPIDLTQCETDGNNIEEFDLTLNNPVVSGTQTGILIEYLDPNGNLIPDPTSYTNTLVSETITVQVSNNNAANGIGTCPVQDTFQISVADNTTAENVTYSLCDTAADGDDTNGITDFDLPFIDNLVLGAQDPTQFTVSYHATLNDATSGNSPLPNTITNGAQSVIFARVQNNSSIDCFATSEVTLQVNPLPVITANVALSQCDTDTDGLSEFNLTEANDFITTNAANETITYHNTLADAENGTNAITNVLNYPNTDPSANADVLFVRVENANNCFRVAQLELFVATSQIPAGFVIPPYEECDDTRVDDNITDGITVFDFSDATPQIEAIFPAGQNITVTYYESTADALSETNAIPDITNHINTASPFNQTITFRVDNNTDNSCQGIGEFELRTTNPTPRTDTESVDLVLCDDVTIGDVSEAFDLTQNETFIFDGASDLMASYFLDFNDALNNITANEITTPTAYNNTNPTETIFVRVVNTVTGCFAIVDFDITVNPLPDAVAITPLEACENATDGFFDFDIGSKREEILNGQDPAIFDVTFHLTQQAADDLTDPQPDTITNTTNPQEIFVSITNTSTGCSNSTQSFFIEVLEGAQINPDGQPLDFEICDGPDNNGSAQFDLNALLPEILDGQDPNDYTITFHFDEDDALAGTPPLPTLYENLVNPQTIYVRVSNNLNPNTCFDVQPIPLIVNPVPEFAIDDQYVLCNTFNAEGVIPVPPVIDTGLSASDFEFVWSLDGTILPAETNPSLIPTQGGIYTVEVFDITTSTITRCSTIAETEVIVSDIPVLTAVVTSQAFAGNHVIEATATGSSVYEFSLDNGPWQDDGLFENVSGGEHIVYARDVNGCGIVSETVLVIDYPLFFTPNGDGRHDTWNIIGIETQPSAKIYIFDRYGKLLKQLSPTSPGWDGTYQGNNLPTDDYWFVVEYIEPSSGETKQQRAHFTLKR